MPRRPTLGMKLRRFFKTVHFTVFAISMSVIVALVLYGSIWPAHAHGTFQHVDGFIRTYFGWYYLIAVTFFLGFALWLMFSRYGRIRLGGANEKPEFSFLAWFSMLFSAGMGIGLVFWSIAEPMYHFTGPPLGSDPESPDAAREAMLFTFFHWGMHAWAIYIVVALTLSYFAYRFKLPFTIRSIFYPILGDKIYGPIGHTIDILAIFATLFGLATSLGLGVMQLNTGLSILTDGAVEPGVRNQVLLIAGITAIAVISVVSGLHRGLKWISVFNLVTVIVLMAFIFIAGPTLFVLLFLIESTGYYLQNVVQLSFWADATGAPPDSSFQWWWTVFYWAWWIAWSPFVGIFIARVSRGRTIREFVGCALLLPTLFVFIWLTIFGGTALHLELEAIAAGVGDGAGIAAAVSEDYTLALWVTLEQLPWSMVLSIVAAVLIVTYFVTSSDSATYVVDALITRGSKRSPTRQRVIWGVTEGAIAAVLLFAGGMYATAAVPADDAGDALHAMEQVTAEIDEAQARLEMLDDPEGELEEQIDRAREALAGLGEALPAEAELREAIATVEQVEALGRGDQTEDPDEALAMLWAVQAALGEAIAAVEALEQEHQQLAQAVAAFRAFRDATPEQRDLDAPLMALQAASIITGLPFSVILLLICYNLFIALRREFDVEGVAENEGPMSGSATASNPADASSEEPMKV